MGLRSTCNLEVGNTLPVFIVSCGRGGEYSCAGRASSWERGRLCPVWWIDAFPALFVGAKGAKLTL